MKEEPTNWGPTSAPTSARQHETSRDDYGDSLAGSRTAFGVANSRDTDWLAHGVTVGGSGSDGEFDCVTTSSDLAHRPRASSTPSPSQKRSTVDKLAGGRADPGSVGAHGRCDLGTVGAGRSGGADRVRARQAACSLSPARERCHALLVQHARGEPLSWKS
jgi:hypothetical protein